MNKGYNLLVGLEEFSRFDSIEIKQNPKTKMSDNPVDEVVSELNRVSLNEADLKQENIYQNIIEKICCDKQKRINCSTHFMTSELMTAICDNLKSSNAKKVCNTANFIALLGKYENCREYLANRSLIHLLIENLKSDNLPVLIQSCRALANICFERGNNFSNFLCIDYSTFYIKIHYFQPKRRQIFWMKVGWNQF